MAREKVVLAYSGGLDTSVAIRWIQENYDYDVIAVGVDLGEEKDVASLEAKALQIGAVKAMMLKGKDELAEEYILPALKANALYQGKYPLSTAVGRPLIVKKLVEIARQENAVAIAHGCTGKGNDQVRFEVSIQALAPELRILAPIRDWKMSREEEIAYARQHQIPIPVNLEKPYSIDANIWGRACEGGVLEDPWVEAPEDAYDLTASVADAPDEPQYVEIDFVKGRPTALDGQALPLAELIDALNEMGGHHGVGRIDHIEDRLVGIKSREVYENAGALILIKAHKELEFLSLPRDVLDFKQIVEQRITNLIYDGQWFSPLFTALNAFVDQTQETVSGKVRVKLWKGNFDVVGRQSPHSLYRKSLATYSADDTFNHTDAVGFINIWAQSTKVFAQVNSKEEQRS